ncbi:hypothetical protein ALC56_05631 [Trachymyrmex septentrionalis]|uniref:Uncharacterized protein n=1 Tax=Trachymyrmex septentrionalis TaxID=34720 RepID=A0A195FHJ9_9HYME|nr:hypothetical protein ALC56_05631 [Trachymyrmex septentrionalis]
MLRGDARVVVVAVAVAVVAVVVIVVTRPDRYYFSVFSVSRGEFAGQRDGSRIITPITARWFVSRQVQQVQVRRYPAMQDAVIFESRTRLVERLFLGVFGTEVIRSFSRDINSNGGSTTSSCRRTAQTHKSAAFANARSRAHALDRGRWIRIGVFVSRERASHSLPTPGGRVVGDFNNAPIRVNVPPCTGLSVRTEYLLFTRDIQSLKLAPAHYISGERHSGETECFVRVRPDPCAYGGNDSHYNLRADARNVSRRSAVTLRTFIVKTKLGANTRAGASW